MNKGRVSAEELRLQLAESLPGSVQIFARAAGVSEAELFKMMEQGQVLAADILPKVAKEMSKVANSGGALAEKYKTARVAQGRFFNQLEQSQNTIFQGGMDEGLGSFFNDLSHSLKELAPALRVIGKVFKVAFTIIGSAIKLVAVPFEILGRVIDKVFSVFGDFSELLVIASVAFVARFTLMAKAVQGLNIALLSFVGKLAAVIGGLLLLEDVWLSLKDSGADTIINRAAGNVNAQGQMTVGGQMATRDSSNMFDRAFVNITNMTARLMQGAFGGNFYNEQARSQPVNVTIAADSQGLIKVVDQRVNQQYSFAEAISN